MFHKLKKTKFDENKLYSKIVFLSRNKLLYSKFNIADTFQNRIYLIFIHLSFLFIKIKKNKDIDKDEYKFFSQKVFDFVFKKIDINMREIGYGDVTVNKNMKYLIKKFYHILLKCENYHNYDKETKNNFLINNLEINNTIYKAENTNLIRYFDKYHSFCVDLPIDNVLKGELIFNYK